MDHPTPLIQALVIIFVVCQVLYALTFLVDGYLFTRPVNKVHLDKLRGVSLEDYPAIVLFYPVLRELETTMRTTLKAINAAVYPRAKLRVVATPNDSDLGTIASLRRLQLEFPFLEVLEVPPTIDPSWRVVWDEWQGNPKAYWWHEGRRAGDRNLPPKKTRQLIYAFYTLAHQGGRDADFLVNYIDADSAPPKDHFLAGAAGMMEYDVLQSQNVAGNLNDSWAASWHALDHMAWDGMKYAHLSANGKQPYWMLGKGLFFRASDLIALGGFHPWITIEDPEVGMRFWKNGRRLGIIENPLIEEVPLTFARGVTQRKRWVCGFFQSLGEPLSQLGYTPWQRFKAWMNFLPCMSLWVNAVGFPSGAWAMWAFLSGKQYLPTWTLVLATFNLICLTGTLIALYVNTWKRTALVCDRWRDRALYMLRINPLFIGVWWVLWMIPLAIGLWMYLRDKGLVWERTEKINANEALIESHLVGAPRATRTAA